ncbi:B3/B4 domain-containing protein [Snodgrassella alvi]|uniref:B3/B4 tRNA-binding domain-containing protein n=1 Tax=Snodgrassella alvi TaxID=1196083 RepID=A0A2N9XZT6_9NEIS|nr:phenylalanine--tRNA ligase beta subunit-related protein [Snodgrassella alvi]PIT57434.1 hypothetical protein BHC49_03165 [Snodgrassella alvi]
MSKIFSVNSDVWQLIPELEIGIVSGYRQESTDKAPADLLIKANQQALKWVTEDPISANPVIKSWRDTFQKFKTKKGAHCAVENLLKRAKQGKAVKPINSLVDVYNSVSLEMAFPIGGFDLDKVHGNLTLLVATQSEDFWAIGENEPEKTIVGEIIYHDDDSVLTRCLNWRDSITSGLTDNTQNVAFLIENNNPQRHADFQAAIDLLQERLANFLDLKTTTKIVNQKQISCELLRTL